jgi:hypothetical protein
MEELGTQTYCQRAALELAAIITHQRRPHGRQRRESALLRRFVTEVLSGNQRTEHLQGGPWKTGTRPLKKPGRGGSASSRWSSGGIRWSWSRRRRRRRSWWRF